MDQQTVDSLAQRLAILEQAHRRLVAANRRMKLVGTTLVIGFAAIAAMGQAIASRPAKSVEAESFIIRDASGKIHGAIGVQDDGSVGINLDDSKGNSRITVDVAGNDTPGIDLYDASGRVRITMAIGPNGTPGLGFYDEAGKLRTSLDIPAATTPGLAFYDTNGKGTFGLPQAP